MTTRTKNTLERLGTLTICGVVVPVFRATVADEPALNDTDGSTNLGLFCADRNIILVRAGQSPTAERDVINHEAVHAFLALSGLSVLLAGVVTWGKGYEDFEEVLARIAAPHLTHHVVFALKGWR